MAVCKTDTAWRVRYFGSWVERLDCSCAIYGPQGELVAHAPHIPVHLGTCEERAGWRVAFFRANRHQSGVLRSV